MRTLTEHLGWKLLSLGLAFLLWYVFVGESEVAASVPVIVQYRNAPPDLEMTGEHPERIFMKVRGPSTRFSQESLSNTALSLDLQDVHSPGERTFTLTEKNLNLPYGVTLLQVMPSQIHLSFQRKASRSVPVHIQYAGDPPSGYRIVAQIVAPERVSITGPEAHVARISAVYTDPIDLRSTLGAAEFRIPVTLPDPQLRLDSPAPVTVSVLLEKIP